MADGIWVNNNEYKTFKELELADEIASRSITNGSFWALIGQLPDPDPVLRKLGQDITIYKDLLADEEVSAAIARRNMGVKSFEWRVQHGQDASDKEVELCETALKVLKRNKTKINNLITQTLNPIYWGYSVFEIIWDKIGKYWLPIRISEKPREWFYFDQSNNLIFKNNVEEVPITGPFADPMMKHKFILLQNAATYENPYGDKALSRCFWPVAFKRGGWRFFTIFVEKYGMPYLVGKQPRNAGESSAKNLLGKLSNMVQDAVAVIPDDSSVEINGVGSKSSSADIHQKYIDLNTQAIQKAILLNSLSMQQHNKGGYSSANAGNEFENILSYDDRGLTEEFFDELFISIIDLNFGSGKYPEYRAYEEDELTSELAKRDETLSKIGDIQFTTQYYKRKHKLQDDEFVFVDKTKTMPNNQAEFAEGEDLVVENIPDTNKLDNKLLQNLIEEPLKPLIKMVKEGKNEEVITEKLGEIYPEMGTKQLEEVLAKVIFISELQGRWDNAAES